MAPYLCFLLQVRMYQGSTILHSFTVEKPVVALRFGFYGREVGSVHFSTTSAAVIMFNI